MRIDVAPYAGAPGTSHMNAAGRSRIHEVPTAHATLMELCAPFAPPGSAFDAECAVVQPEEIPHPDDQLLVHHEHMTVALQRFHKSPVDVHVQDEHLDAAGELYTRKIFLTPRAAPQTPVEWGIVRLDFRYMDDAVRDEILRKQLPLGAILIKHDVHRRIKPRFFLRFPPGGPVLRLFDARETRPVYGRLGTIYCDEEPAIELLEIVTGIGSGPAHS
jgi:chorismate-pyruvate lyase